MIERDACLTKKGFWILVGSIWAVGLLGLIISSIAINNAKNLKDQDKNGGKSMSFLVVMLIVFIAIICGASIYGIGLYVTEQKGEKDAGTPKGVENYFGLRREHLRAKAKQLKSSWERTARRVRRV